VILDVGGFLPVPATALTQKRETHMAAKKGPVKKAVEAVKDTAKTVAKAAEKNVVKPVKKAIGMDQKPAAKKK
jgi:hypothetical protein